MTESASAYGLWSLVIINSVIFIFFATAFTNTAKNTHAGVLPDHVVNHLGE